MLSLWTAGVDVGKTEERWASARWKTAAYRSVFKGLSRSEIDREPIPTLLSTNSVGFYPKGILNWTRQAVETHVIQTFPSWIWIQRYFTFPAKHTNVGPVFSLKILYKIFFLLAPLPLFCTCFALSKLTDRFRERLPLHFLKSCMDSTWSGILWGLQWCSD